MAQKTSEEVSVEECHSPRKALVFDGAPESTLDDYFESLSRKSIPPEKVTHASQIRGDRVCMFFREEDAINELLKEGGLDVKNTFASCQRFHVEPSKVILSNCLPFISNRKLAQTLSQIGKITSPITDVPVNTQLDNFKHVKSFRKTVEIIFPDLKKVPNKIMIEYRTKSVPIYICVEDLLCTECQCYGHCAASCPTLEVTVEKSKRRPRPKSAMPAGQLTWPAKRASSPISSFLCRHAADISWEPALTSSIDLSRESVSSIHRRVPGVDHVLYEPSDSDENTLKEESPTVSGDNNVTGMSRTDSRNLASECRTRPQERPFSADCAKRRIPLRNAKICSKINYS